MKKITYSRDVDILIIELSDEPIAYAEEEGQSILHYSNSDKLVLIEILNFSRFLSEQVIQDLLAIHHYS